MENRAAYKAARFFICSTEGQGDASLCLVPGM